MHKIYFTCKINDSFSICLGSDFVYECYELCECYVIEYSLSIKTFELVINSPNRVTIHFEKEDLPPAEAFWSITVYTDDGFTNPNSLNRATLSSWMPLKYNKDGSLDLYFSNDEPKKDMRNNWYPLPRFGVFNLTMRLYEPDLEVIKSGNWKPPAVQRAEVAH